ncbi:MAG: 4-alpha-glucanotransferase [Acidobacteriota bacterium]
MIPPELADACARRGVAVGYLDFEGRERVPGLETLAALVEELPERAHDPTSSAAACFDGRDVLPGGRGFGPCFQLASQHSADGLGIGDLGDLVRLVDWAASCGASFVGVSPLHAVRLTGPASPYSPISRRWLNPVHLDVAAIPELANSASLGDELARARQEARDEIASGKPVDWAGSWARKEPLLRELHRLHRLRGDDDRRREVERFCETEGVALRDFATFQALEQHLGPRAEWGAELAHPESPAVETFRREHDEDVDFHAFLQHELFAQLERVQERARRSGLALGLFTDLPVGTVLDGADCWAHPELFLKEWSLGCPPDAFAAEGQDWGFPPLRPELLDLPGGRQYLQAVLHATAGSAGLLRIDHALGLNRLFCIRRGGLAAEGAYVAQDLLGLLDVLGQASRDRGVVVVAEDLGLVPEGLRERFAEHGLLSTRVLPFERRHDGEWLTPGEWPEACLACATTHDLPSLPAWWCESDLRLRRELGLLDEVEHAEAREARGHERRALARRLAGEGLAELAADASEPERHENGSALVAAVHSYLARTSARLVAVQLDDLTGEHAPVNLPGVLGDVYPSWTRRQSLPVEEIESSSLLRDTLGELVALARG